MTTEGVAWDERKKQAEIRVRRAQCVQTASTWRQESASPWDE